MGRLRRRTHAMELVVSLDADCMIGCVSGSKAEGPPEHRQEKMTTVQISFLRWYERGGGGE